LSASANWAVVRAAVARTAAVSCLIMFELHFPLRAL
jgi:hypothetical protein